VGAGGLGSGLPGGTVAVVQLAEVAELGLVVGMYWLLVRGRWEFWLGVESELVPFLSTWGE